MSQTRVEIPPGVESSAADGGGESVAADGLGDVGVEVAIKPKYRQTDNIDELNTISQAD